MPKTKHQRLLRLEREKKEKEEENQDDEMEKEPQDKDNEDPTGIGGKDDDNPTKHTSKLDKDFETLLQITFKVKNNHHEMFEALHSQGVYS